MKGFHAMVRRLGLTMRQHLPAEVSFVLIVKNRTGGLVSVIGDLPGREAHEALDIPRKDRAFDDILRGK